MKNLCIVTLVFGLASGANAALTLVGAPTEAIDIGETATITVNNSVDESYSGWLELTEPAVANFDGDPELTPEGNPGGSSTMTFQPEFGAWYQFDISGFPPNPVVAGNHILVHIIGVSEGTTQLKLYASDGESVLATAEITVIPEPATIALLGLGSLLLRRRK